MQSWELSIPARCADSEGVTTAGLKVVPPGQPMPLGEADEVQNLPVQVCPHVSSMNLRPIHSGTGIPGYTFS